MNKQIKSESENLRKKVEGLLNTLPHISTSLKTTLALSELDTFALIHELEVHQIELEMQNDELQCAIADADQAKADAEIAASKYSDLYHLAPSGYFTLSTLGEIIDLNLTSAKMFGTERINTINSRFGFFVSTDNLPVFSLFLDKVFQGKSQETCEVTLLKDGDLQTHVLLTGIITDNEELCNVTMVDITVRKKTEELLQKSVEQLAHLAHHDPLTGLPNRLRILANLEHAFEVAKRHRHKVALMYLDLDRFKHINDTFGHDVGDALLKIIAERLKNCVRAEDTIARIGGDEFTVMLAEVANADDSAIIADKIINTVRKPVTLNGKIFEISASVGISIYPDDALNAEDMLRVADIGMYHAKTEGKNCFRVFTPELALRVIERGLIEIDLRRAIENEEFELYYQPQVRLNDGKIIGLEALIRWNHPEKGQILPEKFISVADELNLIDKISEWILRTAISDHKIWFKKGSNRTRMAVNITGRQISNQQSVKHLFTILEELASESNIIHLDLEITESALEKTEHTISIINELRQFGVMFSIDDFGTGHSSLSRLKQLPIDSLKIDRTFITDISGEGDDKAIVSAIIAMAHSLGLRVIAEGVENKSQLDVLRALDCDEIQGFYFSKPLPSGEIAQLLDKKYD